MRWLLGMLAVAAVFVLLALPARSAAAWTGESCTWAVSGNRIVYYNQDSANYVSASNDAANSWNPTDIDFAQGTSSSYHMKVQDSAIGNTGYDGITNYACTGGHMVSHQVWSNYNTTYASAYSFTGRKQVMVHELGHALGLDHQSGTTKDCGSVQIMYASSDRYTKCGWYSPRTDDVRGINSLY